MSVNVATIQGLLELRDEMYAQLRRNAVATDDLAKSALKLNAAIKPLEGTLGSVGKAAATMNKAVSDGAASTAASFRSVGNAAQSMANVVAPQASRVIYSVNQITSALSLTQAEKAMAGFGTALTVGITLPLALAAKASAETAMEFEKNMTRIETLVGVNRDTVERWKDSVRGMARDVAIGPAKLAEGLYFVTGAGLRGAEALDVLKAAAQASAIGLGDVGTISRTVVAAMEAWGKSNLTATQATEVLIATVREGNLVASEVAGTFGRVMAIASTMGVSFQEVGAFVAAFSRQGVNAAEAVTSLRGVLSLLMHNSRKSAQTLAEVGLSAEILRQEIKDKGLLSALTTLYNTFDQAGKVEQLGDAIPNVRALAGFLATAGTNAEGYTEVLQRMGEYQGKMGEGFARTAETTAFQWAKLKATVEELAEAFGSMLLPGINLIVGGLTSLVGLIADVMHTMNALPGPVKAFLQVALAAFAISGPVMLGILAMTKAVTLLREAYLMLAGTQFATHIITQLTAVRTATAMAMAPGGAARGVWLATAFTDLLNILPGVGTKVAAFGTSLATSLTKPLTGIKGMFSTVFRGIGAEMQDLAGAGRTGGFAKMGVAAQAVGAAIGSSLGKAFQLVKAEAQDLGGAPIFRGLTAGATAAASAIGKVFGTAFSALRNELQDLAGATPFAGLKNAAISVGNAISSGLGAALKKLPFSATVMGWTQSMIAWGQSIPLVTQAFALLTNPITLVVLAIAALTYAFLKWTGQTEEAWALVKEFGSYLYELGRGAILYLRNAIQEAGKAIAEWWQGFKEAHPWIAKVMEKTAALGSEIKERTVLGIADLRTKVQGWTAAQKEANDALAAGLGDIQTATTWQTKYAAAIAETTNQYLKLLGLPTMKAPPKIELPAPIEVPAASDALKKILQDANGDIEKVRAGLREMFAEAARTGEPIDAFTQAFSVMVNTGVPGAGKYQKALAAINNELELWRQRNAERIPELVRAIKHTDLLTTSDKELTEEFGLSAQALTLFKNQLAEMEKPAKGAAGEIDKVREKVKTLSDLSNVVQLQGPEAFLAWVQKYKKEILDAGEKANTFGLNTEAGFKTAFAAASGEILITREEMDKLNRDMTQFAALGALAAAEGNMAAFIKRFGKQITSLGTEVLGLGQPLKEGFSTVFQEAVDADVLAEQVKAALKAQAETIANTKELFKDAADEAFSGITEAARANADALLTPMEREIKAVERQRDRMEAAMQMAGPVDPGAWKEMQQFYQDQIDAIVNKWNEAMAKMETESYNFSRTTLGIFSQLADDIGAAMLAAFQGGGDIGKSIALGAAKSFGDIWVATVGQGDKNKLTKLGQTLGGAGAIMGVGMESYNAGLTSATKKAGALQGALKGAAVGTMIAPGIGTAVGALAGLIGGWIGAAKAGKKARDEFIKSAGGLDALKKAANEAGVSLDALMKAKGKKNVDKEIEKIQKAIEAAKKKADEFKKSLDKLATSGGLMGREMAKAWASIKGEGVDEAKFQFLVAMTDKVAAGFNKIAENAFGWFDQTLLRDAADAMAAFGDQTETVVTKVGSIAAVQGVFIQLLDVVEKIKGPFAELATTFAEGIKQGKPLKDILSEIAKAGKGTLKDLRDAMAGKGADTGALDTLLGKIADRLKVIGPLAGAAFGAMLAQGKSVVEALAAIEPGLAGIETTLKASGLQAEGFLGTMMGWRSIVSGNKEMFDTLSGIDDMLVGLHNSALLTQDTFASLTTLISEAFSTLTSQGVAAEDAIRLMGPQLQKVWELATDFGYAVDETTQSLLDQAAAAGTVGDKFRSSQDRMIAALDMMNERLGQMVVLLGGTLPAAAATGARGVQQALNSITTPNVKIPVEADTSGVATAVQTATTAIGPMVVTADTTQATAAIRTASSAASAVVIPVSADVSQATAALSQMTAPSAVVVPVRADVASAQSALASLSVPPMTTTVQADVREAQTTLQGLRVPALTASVSAQTGDAQQKLNTLTAPELTTSVRADLLRAEAALTGLAAPSLVVPVSADVSRVAKDFGTLDTGPALASVEAVVDALGQAMDTPHVLKVGADTAEAQGLIAHVREAIAAVTGDTPKVRVRTDEAEAALATLQTSLRSLGIDVPSLTVGVEDQAPLAFLEKIRDLIEQVTVPTSVTVETGQAERALAAVVATIDQMTVPEIGVTADDQDFWATIRNLTDRMRGIPPIALEVDTSSVETATSDIAQALDDISTATIDVSMTGGEDALALLTDISTTMLEIPVADLSVQTGDAERAIAGVRTALGQLSVPDLAIDIPDEAGLDAVERVKQALAWLKPPEEMDLQINDDWAVRAIARIQAALDSLRAPSLTVPVTYVPPDEGNAQTTADSAAGQGGVAYEYPEGYARGTKGFVDFGRGRNVTLHGKEAVFTQPGLERLLSQVASQAGSVGGQSGRVGGGVQAQPVYIEVPVVLDGREVSRIVAKHLPRVLMQRGV